MYLRGNTIGTDDGRQTTDDGRQTTHFKSFYDSQTRRFAFSAYLCPRFHASKFVSAGFWRGVAKTYKTPLAPPPPPKNVERVILQYVDRFFGRIFFTTNLH